MAVQDDFIGNLRESRRGISNGSNGLRRTPQATAGESGGIGSAISGAFGLRKAPISGWAPQEIDKPDLKEQNRAPSNTYGGMGFVIPTDEQKSFLENDRSHVFEVARLPLTVQEWDDFENSIGSFKSMLKEYSNEPNQSKRIDLLKRSANTYANVPRLMGYLEAMYSDEDANMNGRYNDFDYRRVQKDVEDAIQWILNYRYSRS